MKNLKILFTLLSFLLASAVLAAPKPITGKWKTIDDKTGKAKSIVKIYKQGGKYYGKILELLTPGDKGKKCTACKGSDKGKPIEGLVIIKDMKPDGDKYSGGEIMDPKNGKSYKCTIERKGNKLDVRGYLGWGVASVGRTQTWHKAD